MVEAGNFDPGVVGTHSLVAGRVGILPEEVDRLPGERRSLYPLGEDKHSGPPITFASVQQAQWGMDLENTTKAQT